MIEALDWSFQTMQLINSTDVIMQSTSESSSNNDHRELEAATAVVHGIANNVDTRRELEVVPTFIPGFMGSIGSRPPICAGRCGGCMPCLPMNVPVSGARTDDEYYPEVWRCICDETMYMP
jgi:hypothetical protein